MTRQTIKAKVAIIRWIIENEEWVKANHPSHREVADKCGDALGFSISPSTIGDIARSGAIGFDWPKPKPPTNQLPKTVSYATLCARVLKLENQIESLRNELGVK